MEELDENQVTELTGIIDNLEAQGKSQEEITTEVDGYISNATTAKREGVVTEDAPATPENVPASESTELESEDGLSVSEDILAEEFLYNTKEPEDAELAREQVKAQRKERWDSFDGNYDRDVLAALGRNEYDDYIEYLNTGEVPGDYDKEREIIRSNEKGREHAFRRQLNPKENAMLDDVLENFEENQPEKYADVKKTGLELQERAKPLMEAGEVYEQSWDEYRDAVREGRFEDAAELNTKVDEAGEYLAENSDQYNKDYEKLLKKTEDLGNSASIINNFKRTYDVGERITNSLSRTGWQISLAMGELLVPERNRKDQTYKLDALKALDNYREESLPEPLSLEDVKNGSDFGYYVLDSFASNAPSFAAMSLAFVPGGQVIMPTVFGAMGLSGSIADTVMGKDRAEELLPSLREQLKEATNPGEIGRLENTIAYHERFQGITKSQKWTAGLMHAGAEILFERFGTYNLLKSSVKTAKALGKEEVKAGFKGWAEAFGKRAAIPVGGFVNEAGTEGLTTLAQNWADINILGDKDKTLMDGVTEAMLQGGIMGMAMTSGGAIGGQVDAMIKTKRNDDIYDTGILRMKQIEAQLKASPRMKKADKKVLRDEAASIAEQLDAVGDISLRNFENLTLSEAQAAGNEAKHIANAIAEVVEIGKNPPSDEGAARIDTLTQKIQKHQQAKMDILDRSLSNREAAFLDNPEFSFGSDVTLGSIESKLEGERKSLLEQREYDRTFREERVDKGAPQFEIMDAMADTMNERLIQNAKSMKKLKAAKKKQAELNIEKANKAKEEKTKGINKITKDLVGTKAQAIKNKQQIFDTIFSNDQVPTDAAWKKQVESDGFLENLQSSIANAVGSIQNNTAGPLTSTKDIKYNQTVTKLAEIGRVKIETGNLPFGQKAKIVYGKNGKAVKIITNSSYASFTDAVHELGHLWVHGTKADRPTLHKKGMALLKENKEWYEDQMNQIKNDPNYSDIKDNQDAIDDEILARAIGNHTKVKVSGWAKWIKELREWISQAFNVPGTIDDSTTLEDLVKLAHFEIGTGNSGFTDIVKGKKVQYSRSKIARTRAAKAAIELKNKEFSSASPVDPVDLPTPSIETSIGTQLQERLDKDVWNKVRNKVAAELKKIETTEQTTERQADKEWFKDSKYDILFRDNLPAIEAKAKKDKATKRIKELEKETTSIPLSKVGVETLKRLLTKEGDLKSLLSEYNKYNEMYELYKELELDEIASGKNNRDNLGKIRNGIKQSRINRDVAQVRIERAKDLANKDLTKEQRADRLELYNIAMIQAAAKKDQLGKTYREFVQVDVLKNARDIALLTDEKSSETYAKKLGVLVQKQKIKISPATMLEIKRDAKETVDNLIKKTAEMTVEQRAEIYDAFQKKTAKGKSKYKKDNAGTMEEMIFKRVWGSGSHTKTDKMKPQPVTDTDFLINEAGQRDIKDIENKVAHAGVYALDQAGLFEIDQTGKIPGALPRADDPLQIIIPKENKKQFQQIRAAAIATGREQNLDDGVVDNAYNRDTPYDSNVVDGKVLDVNPQTDSKMITKGMRAAKQGTTVAEVQDILRAQGVVLDLPMNSFLKFLQSENHGWWTKEGDILNSEQRGGIQRERENSILAYEANLEGHPFYDDWRFSFEGRAFPTTIYGNIQGSEVAKSQRSFAMVDANGNPVLNEQGQPIFNDLTTKGYDKILEQALMTWGQPINFKGKDVKPGDLTPAELTEAANQMWDSTFRDIAKDPKGRVGADFASSDGNIGWANADEAMMFLKTVTAALEAENARQEDGTWKDFKSNLPIYKDASNSAIQFYSGILLDAIGGAKVNLIAEAAKQDGYQDIFNLGFKDLLAKHNESLGRPADQVFDPENNKEDAAAVKELEAVLNKRKEFANQRHKINIEAIQKAARKEVGNSASDAIFIEKVEELQKIAIAKVYKAYETAARKKVGKPKGKSKPEINELIRNEADRLRKAHQDKVNKAQKKEEKVQETNEDGEVKWVDKPHIKKAKDVFWLRPEIRAMGRKFTKSNVMLKAYTAGLDTIVEAMIGKLGSNPKFAGLDWGIARSMAANLGKVIDAEIPGAAQARGVLQSIGSIVAERTDGSNTIHNTGTESDFVYMESPHHVYAPQVKLKAGDGFISPYLFMGKGDVNASKMRSAIAPNFIHSLDAQLLHKMVLLSKKNGYPLFVIHDSFSTSPEYVDVMLRDLKATQASMMDFLGDYVAKNTEVGQERSLELLDAKDSTGRRIIEDNQLFRFAAANLGGFDAAYKFMKQKVLDGKLDFGNLDPNGVKENDYPFSSATNLKAPSLESNTTQEVDIQKIADRVGVKVTGNVAVDNAAIAQKKAEEEYSTEVEGLEESLSILSKGISDQELDKTDALDKSKYATSKAAFTGSADINLLIQKLIPTQTREGEANKLGNVIHKQLMDALVNDTWIPADIASIEAGNRADAKFQEYLKEKKIKLSKLQNENSTVVKETAKGDTFYTQDQAVMAYVLSKNGSQAGGVTTETQAELDQYVKDNPELAGIGDALYDSLAMPNTTEGGFNLPTEIMDRFLEGVILYGIAGNVQRYYSKFFRQKMLIDHGWVAARDAIFSKGMKNKIIATFTDGQAFVDNLESVLRGMWDNSTIDDVKNTKWIKALTGFNALAIGGNFFVAAKQLLSAFNFIETTGPNNFIDAFGAMFTPEYLQTIKKIWKSDYAKNRLGSGAIDVDFGLLLQEGKVSQSGIVRFMENLRRQAIDLAYKPVGYGDLGAILLGGSSYVVNHQKALLKENPDMSADEAFDIAFKQMQKSAETTQQSRKAIKVSAEQRSVLGKLLLSFKTTQLQYGREARAEMYRIKRLGKGETAEEQAEIDEAKRKAIAKILYYRVVSNIMFSAASSLFFAALKEGEEPDEIKKMGLSIIEFNLYGYGVQGTLAAMGLRLINELGTQLSDDKFNSAKILKNILGVSPAISIATGQVDKAKWAHKDNNKILLGALGFETFTQVPLAKITAHIQNLQYLANKDASIAIKLATAIGVPPHVSGIKTKK